VLSFENLAHDTMVAYVGDGLADEIATTLGRIERLEVKSPSLVRASQRAHGADPVRLARALGVRYLVEGSFQRGAGQVRVTVRLVELPSGRQRWSEAYSRPPDDLLRLQQEIAAHAAAEIVGRLLPAERARLERRLERSPAYDLTLQGRFFADRYTGPDLVRAVGMYRRALALDSTFAPAWAGLAMAWSQVRGDWSQPRFALGQADTSARRALAIDSQLGQAWVALAAVTAFRDLHFARADSMIARALALEPTSVEARLLRTRVLLVQGRPDEAQGEARRAWEADSLSFRAAVGYAEALFDLGRGEELLAIAQRFREASPLWSAYGEGAAEFLLGRCEAALAAFDRASGLTPYVVVRRAEVLACLGRGAAIEPLRDSLAAAARGAYVPEDALAALCMLTGDTAQGFVWMERAVAARSPGVLLTGVIRAFDGVRALPRFQAIVRRVAEGMP
jgi:TolB-like protein